MKELSLYNIRIRIMTLSYRVAGHLFSVRMEDSSPLTEKMGNYAPFATGAATAAGQTPDCDQEIFSLEVAGSLPEYERTLLYDGSDEVEDMARISIYGIPGGLFIEMAPTQRAPVCAHLVMSEDFRKGRLKILKAGSCDKFALDNSLMLMFAFATASKGTLEMHSSTVIHEGCAYMFLGESGAGKSTHSRLWLENIPGTVLMNDDNPIVRVMPDGEIRAFGSPWSGKTPCYKDLSAPVAAVVGIKKAPHNAALQLSLPEAYALIYPSCSGFRSDRTMSDALHESIAAFAMSVPAFELECLPDADAALTCKNAVCRG